MVGNRLGRGQRDLPSHATAGRVDAELGAGGRTQASDAGRFGRRFDGGEREMAAARSTPSRPATVSSATSIGTPDSGLAITASAPKTGNPPNTLAEALDRTAAWHRHARGGVELGDRSRGPLGAAHDAVRPRCRSGDDQCRDQRDRESGHADRRDPCSNLDHHRQDHRASAQALIDEARDVVVKIFLQQSGIVDAVGGRTLE